MGDSGLYEPQGQWGSNKYVKKCQKVKIFCNDCNANSCNIWHGSFSYNPFGSALEVLIRVANLCNLDIRDFQCANLILHSFTAANL